MKTMRTTTAVAVILALMLMIGCASEQKKMTEAESIAEIAEFEAELEAAEETATGNRLRLTFKVGASYKVRYQSTRMYKSWLEMPGEEASQTRINMNIEDILMEVTVKEINDDGTANLEVKLLEVKLVRDVDFPETKNDAHLEYVSTAEKTESDWGNEPAMAGFVYHIRMAPDTTVEEIPKLKKLRRSLGIKGDDEGAVARFISEDSIRKRHEREFVQFALGPGRESKETSELFPVTEAMLKAKALRKTFTTQPVAEDGTTTVTSVARAIYKLPRGLAEPVVPTIFFPLMIRENSSMHDLKVTSRGRFHVANGTVVSNETDLNLLLVLLEEDVFKGKSGKSTRKSQGGVMFTQVQRTEKFELVE